MISNKVRMIPEGSKLRWYFKLTQVGKSNYLSFWKKLATFQDSIFGGFENYTHTLEPPAA